MKKNIALMTVAAVLLVIATAGATAYYVDRQENGKPVAVHTTRTHAPQQVAARPAGCDDGNIAGKVLGGAAGGVLASNVGKGSGKTAATIGGTLGGAYIGGEVIPTRNITCP